MYSQLNCHIRRRCVGTHLVHHEHLPLDLAELLDVPQRDLVRRQQNVHLQLLHRRPELVLARDRARGGAADVRDDVQLGRPRLEPRLPGGNRRQRHDDEVGPALLLGLDEERDQRDRLDSLSETLFVFR